MVNERILANEKDKKSERESVEKSKKWCSVQVDFCCCHITNTPKSYDRDNMEMCEHFVEFIQFPLVFYAIKIYGHGYKLRGSVGIFFSVLFWMLLLVTMTNKVSMCSENIVSYVHFGLVGSRDT